MVLPPFDSSRTTQKLCYHRASFQMPNSMVAIVDSPSFTVLQIYFGTNDQLIAEKMEKILKSPEPSPKRFITPLDSDFEDLSTLLVNLRLPLVSRKKDSKYESEAYLVDAEEFYRVVKVAGKGQYQNASLYFSEKSFAIDNRLKCYDNIDLCFIKTKFD